MEIEVVKVAGVPWHKLCDTTVIQRALTVLDSCGADEAVRIREARVSLKCLVGNIHTAATRRGMSVKTKRHNGYVYITKKERLMRTEAEHMITLAEARRYSGRAM